MLCNGYDKVVELGSGELVEMNDARGTTLRVTRGKLWITQERDRNDVVLRAGDVWTVERQGLTVIEAQDQATVCIVGVGAALNRTRNRPLGLAGRIGAWFASLGVGRSNRQPVPYL